MNKKRTISLNKENYLFLLKLVSDELESEKSNADLSFYELCNGYNDLFTTMEFSVR